MVPDLYGFEVLDVVSKPERTKGGINEWATQSYSLNGNMYMMVSIMQKPLSAGTVHPT